MKMRSKSVMPESKSFVDDIADDIISSDDSLDTSEYIDLSGQGYTDYTKGLKSFEVQFLLQRMERRKHTPVA